MPKVDGNLTQYTVVEAEGEIEGLLQLYPVLVDIEEALENGTLDTCGCSGCTYSDIGYLYGWEIAHAWSELDTWYYLLGKERRFSTREDDAEDGLD